MISTVDHARAHLLEFSSHAHDVRKCTVPSSLSSPSSPTSTSSSAGYSLSLLLCSLCSMLNYTILHSLCCLTFSHFYSNSIQTLSLDQVVFPPLIEHFLFYSVLTSSLLFSAIHQTSYLLCSIHPLSSFLFYSLLSSPPLLSYRFFSCRGPGDGYRMRYKGHRNCDTVKQVTFLGSRSEMVRQRRRKITIISHHELLIKEN